MSEKENHSGVQSGSNANKSDLRDDQRGQITPRIIVGVFILAVIAIPLLAAMADFQNSLASTPAFSWFSAGVIAVLLMAAIVAGILGLD